MNIVGVSRVSNNLVTAGKAMFGSHRGVMQGNIHDLEENPAKPSLLDPIIGSIPTGACWGMVTIASLYLCYEGFVNRTCGIADLH